MTEFGTGALQRTESCMGCGMHAPTIRSTLNSRFLGGGLGPGGGGDRLLHLTSHCFC